MEPQNPSNSSTDPAADLMQPEEQVIKPTIEVKGDGPILSPDPPAPVATPTTPAEDMTPKPMQSSLSSPSPFASTPVATTPEPAPTFTASSPSPSTTAPVEALVSVAPTTPAPPTSTVTSLPTEPTPAPNGALPTPVVSTGDGGAASIVLPKKKRLVPKTLFIALLAVLFLGGASASAYFGVIVPNQPENVLKAAVANSLSQPQVGFKGTLDVGPATGSGLAYKTDISGGSNSTDKSAQVLVNLTVSGASISFEARLVDGNMYVKVGDISTIASLLGAYSPELDSAAKSVSATLSNQWIEIDSTLIKESGAGCALDASRTLTTADLKILESQYKINNFVTIVSTSSDTVNGKKVTKMVLSIDDNKASTYTKNLSSVSLVKALRTCAKDTKPMQALLPADGDKTPLTVWIDKGSKEIVQISSQSTAKDATKSNLKGTATIGLSYGNVHITAPTGAKPALQVLTELETTLGSTGLDLTSLVSGASGN